MKREPESTVRYRSLVVRLTSGELSRRTGLPTLFVSVGRSRRYVRGALLHAKELERLSDVKIGLRHLFRFDRLFEVMDGIAFRSPLFFRAAHFVTLPP